MTDVLSVDIGPDYAADGPLREATPYLRMVATAESVGIHVFDLPEDAQTGLSGSVTAGFKGDDLRGLVGLAPNLDEDRRTDVLASALRSSPLPQAASWTSSTEPW